MKILRISRTSLPARNGASFHIHELSQNQALTGAHVTFVSPFEKANGLVINYEWEALSGFNYRWMGAPGTEHILFKSKMSVILYYLYLSRKLISEPYDIVHLHGDLPDILFISMYKLLASKSKFVLTLHGGVSNKLIYKFFMKFFLKKLDGLIVVNRHILTDLSKFLPKLLVHKNIVQSSGVRVEFLDLKRNKGHDGETISLIFIGRLHSVKGVKYLIDAVSQLDNKFKLDIYGDGPEKFELENYSKQLNLSQRIKFHGFVDTKEVMEDAPKNTILLIPSIKMDLQKEGFPTIALEAMASKIYLLASDAAGLSDVLSSKQLFEAGNPSDLVEKISQFDFSINEQNELFHFAQKQEWSEVSTRIIKFYESL